MKVIIKKPNEVMKVIEVNDLKEINKLVGNVDENGEGYERAGTDTRGPLFRGIDMYTKEDAVFNTALEQNFWDTTGMVMYCGNVIFAGYDNIKKEEYGACSLTDEQIEYLEKNIGSKYDIPNIILKQ